MEQYPVIARGILLMGHADPVAKTGEIPSGARKRIEINGERITIFNIDDQFYAILDTCPHKKTAPLVRGTLDGLGIKCPNQVDSRMLPF